VLLIHENGHCSRSWLRTNNPPIKCTVICGQDLGLHDDVVCNIGMHGEGERYMVVNSVLHKNPEFSTVVKNLHLMDHL
jgi:hypothetical protein